MMKLFELSMFAKCLVVWGLCLGTVGCVSTRTRQQSYPGLMAKFQQAEGRRQAVALLPWRPSMHFRADAILIQRHIKMRNQAIDAYKVVTDSRRGKAVTRYGFASFYRVGSLYEQIGDKYRDLKVRYGRAGKSRAGRFFGKQSRRWYKLAMMLHITATLLAERDERKYLSQYATRPTDIDWVKKSERGAAGVLSKLGVPSSKADDMRELIRRQLRRRGIRL